MGVRAPVVLIKNETVLKQLLKYVASVEGTGDDECRVEGYKLDDEKNLWMLITTYTSGAEKLSTVCRKLGCAIVSVGSLPRDHDYLTWFTYENVAGCTWKPISRQRWNELSLFQMVPLSVPLGTLSPTTEENKSEKSGTEENKVEGKKMEGKQGGSEAMDQTVVETLIPTLTPVEERKIVKLEGFPSYEMNYVSDARAK